MLGTSISPVVDFTLKILLDKIVPLTSPVVSLMLILLASNELNLTSPVPPSIFKSPVKKVSFKIDSPVVTTIFKLLQLTFSNLISLVVSKYIAVSNFIFSTKFVYNYTEKEINKQWKRRKQMV
jgi:hypothetical protein